MRAGPTGPRTKERQTRNKTTHALWTIQGLLALIFLCAGGMKLAMPAEELAAAMAALPLPIAFVRFIAVCEVLGALGLVLPGVARIRTELTPLAAAGLVAIMVGAVTTTLATMDASMAVLPLVVGVLAATVAYGRARVAPLSNGPARGVALRPAG